MEIDRYFSVVAVAGQMGSGKTTLTKNLSKVLNARIASFGSFVRAEAMCRKVGDDTSSLQDLGQALIEELGSDEFVRRVLRLNKTEDHIPITLLVDGVRSAEVWQSIQRLVFRSVLVYLDVDKNIRTERILKRDNLNTSTLKLILDHPIELSVPMLQSHADIILYNESLDTMLPKVIGLLISRNFIMNNSK